MLSSHPGMPSELKNKTGRSLVSVLFLCLLPGGRRAMMSDVRLNKPFASGERTVLLQAVYVRKEEKANMGMSIQLIYIVCRHRSL